MSGKLVGNVLNMSYHRNGVSGRGFWTILFEGHKDSEKLIAGYTFVATFFPPIELDEDEDETYESAEACVAVLRVSDIVKGNTQAAWRGDNFHGELQHLVDSYVWASDRPKDRQLDGAGREITDRRGAIKAQKARKD
jgi:hypothetical protein